MNLQPTEIIIIVGIVVLLFGGKKIPELMRGIGRGVGELKKGLDEGKRTLSASIEDTDEEPVKPLQNRSRDDAKTAENV